MNAISMDSIDSSLDYQLSHNPPAIYWSTSSDTVAVSVYHSDIIDMRSLFIFDETQGTSAAALVFGETFPTIELPEMKYSTAVRIRIASVSKLAAPSI